MRLPRLFDSLVFRIGLLLTIALVPIGLIAISQTRHIAEEEKKRSETAILALTAEAAASEESFMRAGQTIAQAFATSMVVLRGSPAECSGIFEAFVKRNGQYSFAGYVDRDGQLFCASRGVGTDASTGPVFKQMSVAPEPRIDLVNGTISGTSVIIMSQPLFDEKGEFDGYVAVSLPNHRIFRSFESLSLERPVDLITFNDEGVVLSAESDIETVSERLPRGYALSRFVGMPRTAFSGTTPTGEARVFAVVPVIPNLVYALGSWPTDRIEPTMGPLLLSSPFLFPAIMWLVSLTVAYLAVHRLAIRNIADLRIRMTRFAATRRFDRPRGRLSVPLEFREIEQTWADLAETVVREEAELENIIHGRTVLLKEVHHRVKNNLQLIASIVSMKIRKAATPEARAALKEVQMRVTSIATVHRALYTTSTIGRVQADELLANIVAKTIEAGAQPAGAVHIDTSYAPISFYPDQAVPLSLLASEAVTNALKYVGRPADGGQPWIRVAMTREAEDAGMLIVENSRGTPLLPVDSVRGTGLGKSLIEAFARQMRGSVDPDSGNDDMYRVAVHFPVSEFSEDDDSIALSEDTPAAQ